MPEQIINNSFKTETLIEMQLPKYFHEWMHSAIPDKQLRQTLLPEFERIYRQNGAIALRQIIERYQKLISI